MIPPHMQKLFPSRGFLRPSSALVKTGDVPEIKSSSYDLLPKGAYGGNYAFFSPDGGTTIIDISNESHTIIAFIAYWYCATRWRAQKIAEAPLMVVEEDQEDGSEEWLPDHELVGILDQPSDDWDMGELLETTSRYLDNTGGCLWVLDRDRIGRIARITPFSRYEFEPHAGNDRLYSYFTVSSLAGGQKDFSAEDCCFFHDAQGHATWGRGRSRLDIAMQWLKLGSKATKTIHDLLGNSMWPSAVMVPDKDWNPDPKTFEAYKQDLEQYARQGNKGKPFVALGGGQFTPLSSSIKDLVPTDILNRVESVVAAISGVPAIVLQFQVGMENSPWSQMAQARRMAYDDTIVPSWRKIERVLTRQMLRQVDDDTTHYIRFDRSQIDSLQRDQMESVQIASLMGDQATLNERRTLMGLEPSTDPKADEIPELVKPSFQDILNGMKPNDPNAPNVDPNANDPAKDPEKSKVHPSQRRFKFKRDRTREEKFRAPVLIDSFRSSAKILWKATVHAQLQKDAQAIAELCHDLLTDTPPKSKGQKERGKTRVMDAVDRYLQGDSKKGWTKAITPLAKQATERAGAVIAADLDITYHTIHPHLIKFAQRETGKLITSVSNTTRSLVSDIVQGGLDAGATNKQIADLISDATGFSASRAELIARTETTKAFNGAPEESLASFAKDSGRLFVKTWSGTLDEKERDEHVAMEGETVPVGEPFSNDLLYPSEPNCRCTSLFDEVEEAS